MEILAIVLALLYLILAIRQNILCWLCAAISTSIYIFLFFEAKLYSPNSTTLSLYEIRLRSTIGEAPDIKLAKAKGSEYLNPEKILLGLKKKYKLFLKRNRDKVPNKNHEMLSA